MWIRFIPALILGQTLYFKFLGAEESKWIFSTLGVEPWGRYLTATLELVAVVLLIIPKTTLYGALLTVGLMAGAIASHLFILGIAVQGDNGLLFGLACIALLSSAWIVWQQREFLPF